MDFLKKHFHFIIISPILPLLIFFIIGIVWYLHNIFMNIIIIVIFLLLFIYQLYNSKKLSLGWFFLYLSLTAGGTIWHAKTIFDYNSFYLFTNNNACDITGVIHDINYSLIYNKKMAVFKIAIEQVKNDNSFLKIDKYILWYTTQETSIQVGDTIILHSIICTKPSDDHFIQYQQKEHIVTTTYNNNTHYTIINHPSWSLRKIIFDQKQKIFSNIEQKLSTHSFSLFSSLFLGNRSYVKNEIENTNEQFRRWGIFHFLARSGLHLALFVLVWQWFLRYLPISLTIKNIIIVILCLVYALLSWSSTPFIRSLLLFLAHKICSISQNSYNLLHYLTLVCICFLLYCPLHIFFLDFQLTFIITYALAWFNQTYTQHKQSLLEQ